MKKTITALMLLVAMTVASTQSISAFTEAGAATRIELGEVYHLNQFENMTLPVDLPAGSILQTGAPEVELFTDESCDDQYAVSRTYKGYGTIQYGNNGETQSVQIYSYDIPAAGRYWAHTATWVMDSSYFSFTDPNSSALNLERVEPTPGSEITAMVNTSGTGTVNLLFSVPTSYTRAYLRIGQTITAAVTGSDPVSFVTVKISQLMREAYRAGLLSADGGTDFTVVVEGLKSYTGTLYGTDGTLEINYKAARKSMELVSTNIVQGRQFLSYYPKGSADAIFTMTFDGDVATDGDFAPYADFGIGQIEYDGKYYYEKIIPTVEGNTLTFDLSGVNRRPGTSAAGVKDGDYYSFKVCNVFDLQHNPAQGLTEANVGSFPYSFIYKVVEEQTIDSDFTPPTGSDLRNYTELTLWHNNSQVIESFEGLRFTYDDGDSYLIPAAELTNSSTEQGEAEYTVTLPEKARTAPVTVSLDGIVSLDGYDKSIQASYNKFVVTYCTPFSEGATMEEIPYDRWMADESTDPADKLIHIRTNYASQYPEMYVWFDIFDVTANSSLRASEMQRLDDGQYVGAWFAYPTTLVGGHVYEARFSAWPTTGDYYYRNAETCLGTYVVTFFGAGEAFVYSPTQFVSIDPDPANGPITPEQNVFTVTYDGLVKLNADLTGYALGMGAGTMKVPFEAVDNDPNNGGYSSAWRLTVDAAGMSGDGIDLHVAAYDMNGATVMGDMMTYTDSDYKSFSFQIYDSSRFAELTTTPADGSSVSEIANITISADDAVGFNWNCTEPIVIYNKLGEVHTVVRAETDASEIFIEPVADNSELTVAEIRLKQPITEQGTYSIQIPEAYFMLGAQFSTNYNKALQLTLTIGGQPTSFPISVEPTDGEVVTEIAKIRVNTSAAIYSDCPDYYMTLVTPTFENIGWSYTNYTQGDSRITTLTEDGRVIGYEFALGDTYTTAGTYTLTIPEKFFELDGNFNSAVTTTFTIEGSEQIAFSPAQGDLVDSFTTIIVRFPGASLNANCSDEATLDNAASFNSFIPLETWTTSSQAIVHSGDNFIFRMANAQSYTAAGEYTFFLPDNFFVRANGSKTMAMYLSFNVRDNGQVSEMTINVSPADSPELTELSVIELTCATGMVPTYAASSNVRIECIETGETVLDRGSIFFTQYAPYSEGGSFVDLYTMRLKLDPARSLFEAGYRLIIPAEFFSDNNLARNEEIVVDYLKRSSAATAIIADAEGCWTVFNLTGKMLLRTTDASDLTRLAPGFYIINGRKCFLK